MNDEPKTPTVKLPLQPQFKRKYSAVDIKLKDGREYPAIAIDRDGNLLGKIVGGQTGLDESLPFTARDIAAYRPYWGLLAHLGFRRWNQLPS